MAYNIKDWNTFRWGSEAVTPWTFYIGNDTYMGGELPEVEVTPDESSAVQVKGYKQKKSS